MNLTQILAGARRKAARRIVTDSHERRYLVVTHKKRRPHAVIDPVSKRPKMQYRTVRTRWGKKRSLEVVTEVRETLHEQLISERRQLQKEIMVARGIKSGRQWRKWRKANKAQWEALQNGQLEEPKAA